MNKLLLFFICFLFMYAIYAEPYSSSDEKTNLNKTEIRAAAFFPMSQEFREIYGTTGLSLQLEQARKIKDHPNLELWGNFEWIFFNGSTFRSCGSSSIDMLNISMGPKGIWSAHKDWVYLYLGIGPDLGIIFIEDKHTCCENCDETRRTYHNSNIGVGGIAKSGIQIFVRKNFYFDFFADYLYLPVQFSKTKDVGGFKLGGGLSANY